MEGLIHYCNKLFGGEIDIDVSGVIALTRTHQVEIVLAFCLLLVVYILVAYVKNVKSNFPPGPFGLPIVGYLPFLSEDTHLDLIEIGKKYGDVFSLKLGTRTMVILNGVEAIKEAFSNPNIQGKPPDNSLKLTSPNSAFFARDIHAWKEQRRFVVQTMNHLGLGKSKIEGDIQDEIKHFLEVLRKQNGQKINPNGPLSPSISNNICALVLGKRYDNDDPELISLDKNLDIGIDCISQTTKSAFFPWMMRLPFAEHFLQLKKCEKAFDRINNTFRAEIEKRKKSFDSKNVRDFIDYYMVEMKNRQEVDPNTSFDDDTLIANVVDLFIAGSETVRTSILWFIYIVAAYPDVQKKIQKEIVEVIGPERMPEYQDHKRMPYTHAVILEVMRWKTLIPLNPFRYTTADTTVGKYHIPQGTVVIGNIWAVHHDPQLWNESDIFKPERFLNAEGTGIIRSSNFMPFCVGKRTCPGENMTNMELFLYCVSILQKFNVAFPDGKKATFAGKFAIIYRIKPYEVQFLPRK